MTTTTPDTSILEIVELEVKLEKSVPCYYHTEVPALFWATHGTSCRVAVCAECKKTLEDLIEDYSYIPVFHCTVCDEMFTPALARFDPL